MPSLTELTPSALQGLEANLPGSVSRQEYTPTKLPEGVVIIKRPAFTDDRGGQFMEIVRITEDGKVDQLKEQKINLEVKQVNVSIIAPGAERFGHIHPNQDELWVVTKGSLTIALYDPRNGSTTQGEKTVIRASNGTGVYIPARVVHGLANYSSEPVVLVYFPNVNFSAGEDTEELRFVPEDPNFWDFAKPEAI